MTQTSIIVDSLLNTCLQAKKNREELMKVSPDVEPDPLAWRSVCDFHAFSLFFSFDHRYTHSTSVSRHIDLLKFLLREMRRLLVWDTVKTIWIALIDNAIEVCA